MNTTTQSNTLSNRFTFLTPRIPVRVYFREHGFGEDARYVSAVGCVAHVDDELDILQLETVCAAETAKSHYSDDAPFNLIGAAISDIEDLTDWDDYDTVDEDADEYVPVEPSEPDFPSALRRVTNRLLRRAA